MQLTIDLFIKNNENFNEIYKKYFCLEWTDRYHPIKQAFWSNKPLKKYNVKVSFINKFTHMPVVLMGNIKEFNIVPERDVDNLEIDKEYENVSFLKSHLQKCIRRKLSTKSVQTSWHLLELDPIQFLRRLCIIYVEDVSFNESFNTVLWLMIALSNNSINLGINHKEWLLGVVHLLSACKFKREYNDVDSKNIKFNYKEIYTELIDKNYKYSDLFFSIFLRMGFGGMKSDIMLFKDSCLSLIKCLNKNNKKWEEFYLRKNKTVNYLVKPLLMSKWELSAIDFHCYSKILFYLQEKLVTEHDMEYTIDELKDMIWNNRSKINSRKILKNNKYYEVEEVTYSQEWYKINFILNSMSKYIIYKYS